MTDILSFNSIGFTHSSAAQALFEDLSLELRPGWHGVVGRNGVGKSTLLKLAIGSLEPSAGRIRRPAMALYCEQRTDSRPEGLAQLLSDPDWEAGRLVAALELGEDWDSRWESLSHGERKRAQIGVALWKAPALLALDEPSNHIDEEALALIQEALRAFAGIGLLVSHSRSLLDALCEDCLFLGPGGVRRRPGGVSAGLKEEEREALAASRAYESAKGERDRLEAEARRRRAAAEGSAARLSKRGINAKDHDAKGRIDAARVSAKDAGAGRAYRQARERLERAGEELAELWREEEGSTGISLSGSPLRANAVLRLEAGILEPHGGLSLRHPELVVAPEDRIALTGRNGAGKSSLARALVAHIHSRCDYLYLAQEIPAEAGRELLAQARALPSRELGAVMSAIARLGSSPRRLLESAEPSPGESRKLALALALSRGLNALVLDEPTNHLDLRSILALEEALGHFRGALLVVSHDADFLRALTSVEWRIENGELRVLA
jgi:macrolide transport system ATP-binding/permease protein